MTAAQKTCRCCSAPLSELQARTQFLCGRPACAWKYQTTPEHHRCAVCSHVLEVGEYVQQTCSSQECRRTWGADRHREAERVKQAILHARAAEWRESAASEAGIVDTAAFTVTVVPHNAAVESELPVWRREALREHITRVATEALDYRASEQLSEQTSSTWNGTPAPSPALADVMINACIGCRGQCCMTGGHHAYIEVNTIVRYMRQTGVTAVSQIADDYLSYLVSHTLQDGCTFQHANGCVLPRAMRSDTCNGFYCDGLRKLQQVAQQDAEPHAFFVPMDDGQVVQGTFAGPNFVRIVRREL